MTAPVIESGAHRLDQTPVSSESTAPRSENLHHPDHPKTCAKRGFQGVERGVHAGNGKAIALVSGGIAETGLPRLGRTFAKTALAEMIALVLAVGAKVQWRPYTSTGPSPLAASRSAVAPENPAVARGGSRFFLDTADVTEWAALLPLGMFHGVTTNPTLLERAGVACTVEACRQLAVTAGGLGVEEIMFQACGATLTTYA